MSYPITITLHEKDIYNKATIERINSFLAMVINRQVDAGRRYEPLDLTLIVNTSDEYLPAAVLSESIIGVDFPIKMEISNDEYKKPGPVVKGDCPTAIDKKSELVARHTVSSLRVCYAKVSQLANILGTFEHHPSLIKLRIEDVKKFPRRPESVITCNQALIRSKVKVLEVIGEVVEDDTINLEQAMRKGNLRLKSSEKEESKSELKQTKRKENLDLKGSTRKLKRAKKDVEVTEASNLNRNDTVVIPSSSLSSSSASAMSELKRTKQRGNLHLEESKLERAKTIVLDAKDVEMIDASPSSELERAKTVELKDVEMGDASDVKVTRPSPIRAFAQAGLGSRNRAEDAKEQSVNANPTKLLKT